MTEHHKSPCCQAPMNDHECEDCEPGEPNPDCETCQGDGVIEGYLECSACGEVHDTSYVEHFNND